MHAPVQDIMSRRLFSLLYDSRPGIAQCNSPVEYQGIVDGITIWIHTEIADPLKLEKTSGEGIGEARLYLA